MSQQSDSRWPAIRAEVASLWKLAWPTLVGQLAVVGTGVADVAMTGHLSAAELAAASVGASLWTMIIVTVIGTMMAVNALVAHELGARRHDRVPHIVRQAMWAGFGIGALACVAANGAVVVFDYLSLDPAVHAKASTLVHVISIGLPPLGVQRALYGYSTSLHQTKPMMVISLTGLLFNIAVNWLLIYGNLGFPQLGAIGCAVATGLCMWLTMGLMLYWIRRAPAYRTTHPFARRERPHWSEIAGMLKIGLPIGVTYFAEVSAFSAVALLVARFGVVTVSAHQIALNFASLTFMVPMSLGIALITRVGNALGAGKPLHARFVAWTGVGVALAFALASAVLIALCRHVIAAAYSTDPQVQALTARLLLFAALFQLSDATQTVAASAIRGYKVTRPPMVIHLASFWGICMPLGCLLGLAPDWMPLAPARPLEAAGFWIALTTGLTVAALLLVWFLNRLSRDRTRLSA